MMWKYTHGAVRDFPLREPRCFLFMPCVFVCNDTAGTPRSALAAKPEGCASWQRGVTSCEPPEGSWLHLPTLRFLTGILHVNPLRAQLLPGLLFTPRSHLVIAVICSLTSSSSPRLSAPLSYFLPTVFAERNVPHKKLLIKQPPIPPSIFISYYVFQLTQQEPAWTTSLKLVLLIV